MCQQIVTLLFLTRFYTSRLEFESKCYEVLMQLLLFLSSEASHHLFPISTTFLLKSTWVFLYSFFFWLSFAIIQSENLSYFKTCSEAKPLLHSYSYFQLMTQKIHSILYDFYYGFYWIAKLLSRMLFVEKNLRFKTLDLQIDYLRYLKIKTDTAYFLLREIDGEILMKGASCYQKKIDFDRANLLPILLVDTDFKKLLS